jgi:hypothetical protein
MIGGYLLCGRRLIPRIGIRLEHPFCRDLVDRLYVPNLSDLRVATTHSGGRKARPYESWANFFGRGGVYPRPQRTRRSPEPPDLESVDLGDSIVCHSSWQLKICMNRFLSGAEGCRLCPVNLEPINGGAAWTMTRRTKAS